MTTIVLTIGADTVSDDVVRGRVTFEENSGVGTLEVIIQNDAGEWLGDFAPYDVVTLQVDGATMFVGYLDDTEPYIDPEYVALDLMRVTATDYGFDLQRLYITADYELAKDDDAVAAALTASGTTDVTYTSASTGTSMSYSFRRTYLSEGFKEMAEERGKCFYVDQSKALHWFAKDAAAEYLDGLAGRPDVDLILNSEDTNNNILDFKHGEVNGSKLFNYVELVAGPLMDHWTELNASAWTAGTGCTVENASTTVLNDYLVGRASIKISRTASDSGTLSAMLDIYNGGSGRYEHSYMDLSKNDTGSVCMLWYGTQEAGSARTIRIFLTDSSDRTIEFRRHVPIFGEAPLHNRTDYLQNGTWVKVDFPYGNGVAVSTTGDDNERWSRAAGATFTWSEVKSIKFDTDGNLMKSVAEGGGYLLIDGLTLPTVEVKSIDSDASSISSYGKRMFTQQRPDVISQVELDAMVAYLLPQKKNPLETIHVVAIGNTSLKYPSQTVDVQAVPKGIVSLAKYRIVKLSHKFWSKRFREREDRDFITELDLISQSASDDSLRRAWNQSAAGAAIRQLRMGQSWASRYENAQPMFLPEANYPQVIGPAVSNNGATFPTTPAPNETFYLTAAGGGYEIGLYRYNEGTSTWILEGSAVVSSLTGNITANQIAANTIAANMIQANAVNANHISANSVTANAVAANAIQTNHLSANSITVNQLAANSVEANKIQANAVTANKILAQQVSIDKLTTDIGNENSAPVLFAKLTEYSYGDYAAVYGIGQLVYTRVILAETSLKYRIRQLQADIGTSVGGRCWATIQCRFGTQAAGFQHAQGMLSVYTKEEFGAGSYAWNYMGGRDINTESYRAQSGYYTRAAGTAASVRFYYNLPAPVDLSDDLQVHLYEWYGWTGGTIRLICSTDTDQTNYYYKDINTAGYGYPTEKTLVANLADFTAVGTPDWANINRFAIEATGPAIIGIGGFAFTECYTYHLERGGGAVTEENLGDDGTFTLTGPKNADLRIEYYVGGHNWFATNQTYYLNYPASDVRGISYLEDVEP